MTLSPITFPICHPREIEKKAISLTNRIAASRGTMSDIIAHINATAVTQAKYTRSLALLVKKMVKDLRWRNTDLFITFQEDITHSAVSIFFNYWRKSSYRIRSVLAEDDSQLDDVDPFAVNAYIGDLFSLGLLPFDKFDFCAGHLLGKISSGDHLWSIYTFFAHAGANNNPDISPVFVRDSLAAIFNGLDCQILASSKEASALTDLLHHLMYRTPRDTFPQRWDRNMNLDDALMASASSCSPKPLPSHKSSRRPSTSRSMSSPDTSPDLPHVHSYKLISSMESSQMKLIWQNIDYSPLPGNLSDLHLFD